MSNFPTLEKLIFPSNAKKPLFFNVGKDPFFFFFFFNLPRSISFVRSFVYLFNFKISHSFLILNLFYFNFNFNYLYFIRFFYYSYLHNNYQQKKKKKNRTMTTTWSSGICDCCSDCGSCCLVYWCFCIQYGYNAEKIDSGSCCLCATLSYFLSPCVCCLTMYQRGLVRSKYGIEGNTCNDCLCSFFCTACALCQIAREVDGK